MVKIMFVNFKDFKLGMTIKRKQNSENAHDLSENDDEFTCTIMGIRNETRKDFAGIEYVIVVYDLYFHETEREVFSHQAPQDSAWNWTIVPNVVLVKNDESDEKMILSSSSV